MTQEPILKEVQVKSTETRNVTFDEFYNLLSEDPKFLHTKLELARELSLAILQAPCHFMRFNLLRGDTGILAVVSTLGIAEALKEHGGEDEI